MNQKWLNYHHLYYFKVIATTGSIAKASEVLLVGQPALSSQLKQLEHSLNQKLFERKNKGLHLTEAGRVALEYAETIFKKGEEFLQVFNEQNLSSKTIYKVGVVASAPKILAGSLMQMAKKFGKDNLISMREDPPEELIKKISAHELDIALTNNLSSIRGDDLIVKKIGEDNVSIFGSKKFSKLKTNFPKSINGKDFILPTMHSKLRYDLEHTFRAMGVKYKLVAEVQDSSVKKALAMDGVGLISLPDFACKSYVKEKKLYKLGSLEDVVEEYWIVAKKRTIKSPITEKLLKEFKMK